MKSESVLTKRQVKKFKRQYRDSGELFAITAEVRFDDECGNGHNTFSITGTILRWGRNNLWVDHSGGCIHEDIAKRFPELAPYIKWHLCSTGGPMHYVENALYHALQHGPTHAWVYYKGKKASDPLGIGDDGVKERLLGYENAEVARSAEGQEGYRVEWDLKTAKERNLDWARSSAIWPDATDEQLTQEPEKLKAALLARLPALMAEFRKDVESLGFVW